MKQKDPMFQFPTDKIIALSSIYDSAGLQVVFDIMEKLCDEAENDFISTHPSDKDAVLAGHAILHAQRIFFNQVVQKIDNLVQEQRPGLEKDNRRLRIEQEERILSALPLEE